MNPNILLVEDSNDVAELVRVSLGESCDLSIAPCVADARALLDRQPVDLVILDVMLPDGDGLTLCSHLQADERLRDLPVMFLTARTELDDKIAAFAAGADDYVEKPFERRELRARVEAKLRKMELWRKSHEEIRRGDVRLHLPLQKAFVREAAGERELDLTPHEFKLLFQLAREEERTVTREELMQCVWGQVVVYERTIDSHLSNLRKKLGERGHYVQSVRGVGYRFSPSA